MKWFIFLFFSLFLFACNKEVQKNEIALDTNKLRAEEQKYIQKMEKIKNNEYDYSKNYTPEELKKFLPNEIAGFERLPNSIGTQSKEDGTLYTFAKGQFQNNERQNIVIDIFDYGAEQEVPDKNSYFNPPSDLDVPSKKFQDEFSDGFINIDKNLDQGRLEVLINNRFVVVVRINKNIKDVQQFIDIYKKVNIKKLKSVE